MNCQAVRLYFKHKLTGETVGRGEFIWFEDGDYTESRFLVIEEARHYMGPDYYFDYLKVEI